MVKETTTHQMTIHDWLEQSQPGDRYIYYTGNLAQDTGNKKTCNLVPETCFNLFRVVEAGNSGLTLVQRRTGNKFEYMAVRLKGKTSCYHQL